MNERIGPVGAAPTGAPTDPPPGFRGRLPFGFRVLAGLGALLAVLSASIVVAAYLIFNLSQDQAQLQDRNVPYAVAIATAALNAKGMANDERGFLISGNREFLEEIDQRLLNARTAFAVAVSSADGEVQREAASEARAGFERWVWAMNRQFKTAESGDRQSATKAALGPGRALRKDYEASLAEAQGAAKTAIQLRRNSFASSGWVVMLLASLLVVLAIGFGATFWLMSTLEGVGSAAVVTVPSATSLPTPEPLLTRVRRR